MGVFGMGLSYIATTFVLLFSGMPIAFALGSVAIIFMFIFMPVSNIHMVAQHPLQ